MNHVKSIELVTTLDVGGALYCISPEKDGNILLGLGLWDRANSPHTLGVKDATKGQVIRVDKVYDLMSASPELSNIIYQLLPLEDGRIFVGCRNGELMYLNKDLSIKKKIDLKNNGLYFFTKEGNTLIATMREGAVLFYDLVKETAEILSVVSNDVRLWPILKDEEKLLVGSYRGHIAEIRDRKVVAVKRINGENAAIWTIDKFNGNYLVGTARGELISLDERLENPTKIMQLETGISYAAKLNQDQLAIGDVKGNVHILNKDYSSFGYKHLMDEKISNTIWSIAPDHDNNLLRVGHSNGQMRTFRLS